MIETLQKPQLGFGGSFLSNPLGVYATDPSSDPSTDPSVDPSTDPSVDPDSTGDYQKIPGMQQAANALLKSGNVLLALAYIFAVLQLQDQDSLAQTAKELNDAAQKNTTLDGYATALKNIVNELQSTANADKKTNPTIGDSGFKNNQKELDKYNAYLAFMDKQNGTHTKPLTMDEFNALSLTSVMVTESNAEEAENNAGAIKNSLQTTTQMKESQLETVSQFLTSVISGFKGLCTAIAQNIGR